MNENKNPWDKVSETFQAFGKSLNEAVESGWNDPKTQDVIEEIKKGLNGAVQEIDTAIESVREDPKVKDFVDEAKGTFEQFEEAGKEAFEDAKPHIRKAMESMSGALNKAISDLKPKDPPEAE